jgi:hypothetical protein
MLLTNPTFEKELVGTIEESNSAVRSSCSYDPVHMCMQIASIVGLLASSRVPYGTCMRDAHMHAHVHEYVDFWNCLACRIRVEFASEWIVLHVVS